MPQLCKICRHPKRQEIEENLLSGTPLRNVVERFKVSIGGLHRHKMDHLLESVQRSHQAAEVLRSDALIDHVKHLRIRTEGLYSEAAAILDQAKRSKDLKTALAAIREAANVTREARGNVHLLAQLTGELTNVTSQTQIAIVLPATAPPNSSAQNQPSAKECAIDIALPLRSLR